MKISEILRAKGEFRFNCPLEVMKFTLTYDGPLPSSAKVQRKPEKMAIRRQVHKQLVELFNSHPALTGVLAYDAVKKTIAEINEPNPQAVLNAHRCGGFHFVPFVTRKLWLVCGLDILFLRRQAPGTLFQEHGDLDNRLLTLFDGLRMPHNETDIPAGDAPAESETPMLCLLEDDSLITNFSIDTERLLTVPETGAENHVRLVIDVTVKAVKVLYATVGLLGD